MSSHQCVLLLNRQLMFSLIFELDLNCFVLDFVSGQKEAESDFHLS